jgi:hypothetical protein
MMRQRKGKIKETITPINPFISLKYKKAKTERRKSKKK